MSRKCKKTVFPAYFRHFRPEKCVFRKIGLRHILGIVILHQCDDEISRKCQKTSFSGVFPAFSTGNEFLPEIGLRHILGIAILHLCAKNQQKLMMKYRENAKKPVFRHISGILGRKNMFFENRARSHFRHCHFASVCKISCKNIKYSSRNSRNTVFPAKIGCSGDF